MLLEHPVEVGDQPKETKKQKGRTIVAAKPPCPYDFSIKLYFVQSTATQERYEYTIRLLFRNDSARNDGIIRIPLYYAHCTSNTTTLR